MLLSQNTWWLLLLIHTVLSTSVKKHVDKALFWIESAVLPDWNLNCCIIQNTFLFSKTGLLTSCFYVNAWAQVYLEKYNVHVCIYSNSLMFIRHSAAFQGSEMKKMTYKVFMKETFYLYVDLYLDKGLTWLTSAKVFPLILFTAQAKHWDTSDPFTVFLLLIRIITMNHSHWSI